jgi:two-component system chemotaxis response regulator CheY
MKKIVIAEDSKTMRLFIKMSLRHMPDIVIFEASNGAEAFNIIKKESPSLIITDIHMPETDGLELIKRVRGLGLKTPIIVLTTDGERQDMERAVMLGADGYATKPIMVSSLVNLVDGFLRLAA